MHKCPHCGTSVETRAASRATKRKPFACPNCSGRSWYCAPNGAAVFQALVVAVILGTVLSVGLTGWVKWVVAIGAAVVAGIPIEMWKRRRGWLSPVSTVPHELEPNKALERTRER
jgi:hypothetical protein